MQYKKILKTCFVSLGAATMLVVTLLTVHPAQHAHAATSGSLSVGYSVSPLKLESAGNPGDSIPITVNVTNLTKDRTIPFNVQVVNFTPKADGTPDITNTNNPVGLASWVKGSNNVVLPPGSSDSYKATIAVPKNTAPGAYYAVVLLNNTDNASEAAVGVLLIANIGNVTKKVSVESIDTTNLQITEQWKLNGQALVNIVGTGTGYVVPEKMVLEIRDEQKRTIMSTNANDTKAGVLPKFTRSFAVPVSKLLTPNQKYFANVQIYLSASEPPVTFETQLKTPPYVPAKSAPAKNRESVPKKNIFLYIGGGVFLVLAGVLVALLVHDKAKKRKAKQLVAEQSQPTPPAPTNPDAANIPPPRPITPISSSSLQVHQDPDAPITPTLPADNPQPPPNNDDAQPSQ